MNKKVDKKDVAEILNEEVDMSDFDLVEEPEIDFGKANPDGTMGDW